MLVTVVIENYRHCFGPFLKCHSIYDAKSILSTRMKSLHLLAQYKYTKPIRRDGLNRS